MVHVAMALLAAWWGSAAGAQSATAPALKAAFVQNFAKFTEWPAGAIAAGAPLVLCVVGDSAIAQLLEQGAKGQKIEGRPLLVAKLKPGDPLPVCHVLYAGVDKKRAVQLLEAVKGAPILTVSDLSTFTDIGGMVQFFVEEGRMQFAINVDAAHRCKLQLRSQLLTLAKLVKDDPHAPSR